MNIDMDFYEKVGLSVKFKQMRWSRILFMKVMLLATKCSVKNIISPLCEIKPLQWAGPAL
jgi:hypothetical protein